MRPCIFCYDPADSKEDLFPRWILKRVVTGQPLYRQMGDAPPEITEDQEVRIPCVCQKCNNTWMSGMETTVKKFLGPMIEDLALPLDRQNQQKPRRVGCEGRDDQRRGRPSSSLFHGCRVPYI